VTAFFSILPKFSIFILFGRLLYFLFFWFIRNLATNIANFCVDFNDCGGFFSALSTKTKALFSV
jgi:hypothetical protein